MGNVNRGLYNKFSRVERSDGRDVPGEKHHGCRYFVLDLDHDEFSSEAMHAYSIACAGKYPQLSGDITRWLVGEEVRGFGKRARREETSDGD